jgi:hypothetical protein
VHLDPPGGSPAARPAAPTTATRTPARRTRRRTRCGHPPRTRGGRGEPGRRQGDRGRARAGRAVPGGRPIPGGLRRPAQPGPRLAGIAFPGTTYPEVNRLGQVTVPDSVTLLGNGDLDVPGLGRVRAGFTRTDRGVCAFGSPSGFCCCPPLTSPPNPTTTRR